MEIKKLIFLQKEIYRSINDASVSFYPLMQSIYEHLGKEFLNLEMISLKNIGLHEKSGAIGIIN